MCSVSQVSREIRLGREGLPFAARAYGVNQYWACAYGVSQDWAYGVGHYAVNQDAVSQNVRADPRTLPNHRRTSATLR